MTLARANISLRAASDADWPFLSTLQETCMREYAEQIWGRWTPEPRENYRPEIHQVIRYRRQDVGCLAIVEEPDSWKLEKLYILPSHQRRGIGSALLQYCIANSHRTSKPIHLRVLRVNPARRLYERQGFTVDRVTEERYFMSYTVASVSKGVD
jgi:GNAT superfamily N-acetyltransferase